MLVPLCSNSAMLLTEDETDTEISTTTNTTNRPMGNNDNDSIISDPNGPKWYKSSSPSTIVSNDSSAHYSRHAVDMQKHHMIDDLKELRKIHLDSYQQELQHVQTSHSSHKRASRRRMHDSICSFRNTAQNNVITPCTC